MHARHEPCSSKSCTPASPDGPVPARCRSFSATERSRCREPAASLSNASSAAQGLCHDDQQRRSQGEMGRTEGLCEARYQGLAYAGRTRPPIIIYCRTPHTRLSGASFCYCSRTAQLHNHYLLSRIETNPSVAGRSPLFFVQVCEATSARYENPENWATSTTL